MIEKIFYGKTQDGQDVYKYTLKTKEAEASFISYGATWLSFNLIGGTNVILGYNDLLTYETSGGYLGATVGRNSNRIKNAQFTLIKNLYNVDVNNKSNNLHGGKHGFSKKVFFEKEVNHSENSVTLSYFSKDLEGGFPGNMDFSVKFTLNKTSFSIEYFAVSDKDTVCNPTNHAYFNLGENVLDTYLQINSSFITVCNERLEPTGEIIKVENTPFDFTVTKPIGKDIKGEHYLIAFMKGYDVNYCLSSFNEYEKVATAKNSKDGLTLNVYTDRPAVQFYTSKILTERVDKNGEIYKVFGGFCLETQTYSGATNNPHFPTPFIRANEKFYSKTTYELVK
ncbi:MAG: galactose mutarotase [Clostridia bacterium]|nr:galactose mutarotase [Clostridia bacterium]